MLQSNTRYKRKRGINLGSKRWTHQTKEVGVCARHRRRLAALQHVLHLFPDVSGADRTCQTASCRYRDLYLHRLGRHHGPDRRQHLRPPRQGQEKNDAQVRAPAGALLHRCLERPRPQSVRRSPAAQRAAVHGGVHADLAVLYHLYDPLLRGGRGADRGL